ncbi:SULT1C3 [Branchiostoma lanceolatum]|uniref:Sulfotransferase n=1 Tax=Branchiostoma lanceolatum TaxID=7740 RepID=A0A8K0EZ80_BRALA|nr:SULT1C3 [Branchiostoma lanceolatum]
MRALKKRHWRCARESHRNAWWAGHHVKDLLSAVKTIVTFLEVDLDESTVKDIAEASTFNNMKPVLDNSTMAESRHIARKGIVGDWKNTFSTEESEAFDTWCEKKLGGTGLTFDFE